MEKRTFVRLQKLVDVTYEGETAEQRARWLRNVLNTVGAEGYTLGTTEDGCEDTAEFACEEMEFDSVEVYDFMGSAYEDERFFAKDVVVFRNKANGEFYVLNAENLWEF